MFSSCILDFFWVTLDWSWNEMLLGVRTSQGEGLYWRSGRFFFLSLVHALLSPPFAFMISMTQKGHLDLWIMLMCLYPKCSQLLSCLNWWLASVLFPMEPEEADGGLVLKSLSESERNPCVLIEWMIDWFSYCVDCSVPSILSFQYLLHHLHPNPHLLYFFSGTDRSPMDINKA